MGKGSSSNAVPAFCAPLTVALYVLLAVFGFVFTLTGAAYSVYGRGIFIGIGLFIVLLGVLGIYINQQRYWLKALVLNAFNFVVFVSLVVGTLIAIIFAFDIRDPVAKGVREEWDTGGLRGDLEKSSYCENFVDVDDKIARDGLSAVTEKASCSHFYKWAKATQFGDDKKRCEGLDALTSASIKLTKNTIKSCKVNATGTGCAVQSNKCKFTAAKITAATCEGASSCQAVPAKCDGTHDGTKGAACKLNANSTSCAVKGGVCKFASGNCTGTHDGTAGTSCKLNPAKSGCAVSSGSCSFVQGKCQNSTNCNYTAATGTAAKCEGSDDGTGSKGGSCPVVQCSFTVATMATKCKKLISKQPGGKAACDTTPKSTHFEACKECDVMCRKRLVSDLQTAVSATPFFCYFIFFFLIICLIFNVVVIDLADDIDTFHAFMEMEAATLGVAHFLEDRPKFEGLPIQKRGLLVNLFAAFLGFLTTGVAIFILASASKHFQGLGICMLLIGLVMMGLCCGIYLGIKTNSMGQVRICNFLLFVFGFLILVIGIMLQLATGSTSDLHTRIDADYEAILKDIEEEEPNYCGTANAQLSKKACKDKLITDIQENISYVAYVGIVTSILMAVIMWLTHNMSTEYYRGHKGEDTVPGKLDNSVKKKIEGKTDHVRRLSPEDMETIQKWKYAIKEGKSGLSQASGDELVFLVIGSIHSDDDLQPNNPEAIKFLEFGDLLIKENKAVGAGVKYQHGRDIEPGNPKLKARCEAVRRHLVQSNDLDKMIGQYKAEVADMNTVVEEEFVPPPDLEEMAADENDFFNKAKNQGRVKKKAAQVKTEVAEDGEDDEAND